jgi:hypothetical protein
LTAFLPIIEYSLPLQYSLTAFTLGTEYSWIASLPGKELRYSLTADIPRIEWLYCLSPGNRVQLEELPPTNRVQLD